MPALSTVVSLISTHCWLITNSSRTVWQGISSWALISLDNLKRAIFQWFWPEFCHPLSAPDRTLWTKAEKGHSTPLKLHQNEAVVQRRKSSSRISQSSSLSLFPVPYTCLFRLLCQTPGFPAWCRPCTTVNSNSKLMSRAKLKIHLSKALILQTAKQHELIPNYMCLE